MELGSVLQVGGKVLTQVAKKAYVKSICEIKTLESSGLKLGPLKNDVFFQSNKTSCKIIDTMPMNVEYTFKKPPNEWLIHVKDFIKPEELKNLKEWDDYVLLIHYSDKASIIKKDGLHCCTDINPEKAFKRRSLGFVYDPDLIYFMPKTPHSLFTVDESSIVIAVPKKNVRVFNQDERISGNFVFYADRSMPIEEYDKLLSEIKPGQYLRGDKQIVSCGRTGFNKYMPEVCFGDGCIPIEYFVRP